MKRKYKIIAILLSIIMLITACDNNQKESIDTDSTTTDAAKETSRFLYTIEGSKIVRYDVVEQKEIIACPDPFCEHDSYECPVFDVSSKVHFTNDYIAFVKEGSFTETYYYPYNTLYLYDLTEGSITTILDDASQIYYPWVSTNREYVFFTGAVMLFDENGDSTEELWYVYRYNIESGELETINGDEKISTAYRVIQDTGERLLWYTNLYGTYFWSDYEYGNIEEYDYPGDTVGDYYIYSDINYTEYDDYYRTMYRQSIETSEVTLISDYVSEMRYDNKESPSGIAYAMFDYNEEYGYNAKSEIWWFDCETLEKRLLIDVKDISDEFDTFRITS
ncbi:MAG: hypothetical protein LUH54_02845, partial [Firmicutes bacterium]|nr:hypothetical protein [Bacillota bacterium]